MKKRQIGVSQIFERWGRGRAGSVPWRRCPIEPNTAERSNEVIRKSLLWTQEEVSGDVSVKSWEQRPPSRRLRSL